MDKNMEASFSILTMSLASSAAMALGLAPDPSTGKVEKDKQMAKFNIDLLAMLKDKTKGHLTKDEQSFLDTVLADLQMKFIQEK